MYLFQKIEELMMNYSDARKTVGQFVLDEKSKVHQYTIQEIAEKTYTSKATVVRFAKTLGYDGWKDFLRDFISEVKYQQLHSDDLDVNYPFDEKTTTNQMIESLMVLQTQSIKDTYDLMDEAQLKKASQRLMKAKHITILSWSPNCYVAYLFRRKMMTIEKQVEVATLGEMGTVVRSLREGDCVILISYSGNNPKSEPMCYIELLKEKKIPVIAITSDGNNYIRKHCDCVLTMSSRERLYSKIANFATEESLQFILNCLFALCFKQNYKQNIETKLKYGKALEKDRITVLNQIKDIPNK
ncbi:MAG: MurR/RpiR family transcriptional regulator [Holdemanella sp.]|nr:MurR/RpiR family transcriptional regulator [Holdemanella sp.]